MSAAIKTRIRQIASTHDLWQIAETGDVGQLRQLLARGADVNASNGAGVTALMLAAYHGRLEMVRALTDHGADVNLKDAEGFTAAMLADRYGHDEIVNLLVARGAKHIPKRSAQIATADPFSQEETFDSFTDVEASSTYGDPEVRKLHAPPNIWDVVHEARTEFKPRSALVGHLTSVNPLVILLMVIIAGELAVIGFMNRKTRSESAEPQSVRTEASNTTTAPSVPATVPSSTSVSNQQPSSPATGTGESSPVQPLTTTAAANPITASVVKPKIAVPTKKPEKAVTARQPGEEQIGPILSGAQTLAGSDKANKDESKESTTRPPKIELALPLTDNEKSAGPPVKKEEAKKDSEKAPSPPIVVTPKANPTPRLR
jgi:hypothetical protein